MAQTYVEIAMHIMGETDQQEVAIQVDLTVGELIQETIREFELDETDNYLLLRENGEELDPLKTLIMQTVMAGDILFFERFSHQYRAAIDAGRHQTAKLLDRRRSHSYPIEWTPAIIGRSDTDQHHMAQLAVNLEALLGRRISRKHAQITREGETYYIEQLSQHHPCYLNDHQLQVGIPHPLNHGDLFRPKPDQQIVLEFVLT